MLCYCLYETFSTPLVVVRKTYSNYYYGSQIYYNIYVRIVHIEIVDMNYVERTVGHLQKILKYNYII